MGNPSLTQPLLTLLKRGSRVSVWWGAWGWRRDRCPAARERMSSPCWSPTAADFSRHQLAHVTNFWRQGRAAEYRLKALPSGRAELCLTFELPSPSESVPPPMKPAQSAPPRNVMKPLFPQASPKVSSRQRKSYRRSVLHRAGLVASSLPPPKLGSLRQAASARVQCLQADRAKSERKRPRPDSPSFQSPLAQRIQEDFQISENEVDSPEKETLRSQTFPEKSPPPNPPYVKGFPPPAPLVFTPSKIKAVEEAESVAAPCQNCEQTMTPDHQCELPDPLPVCHYCCHKGSGDYPVHYFQQCMCEDSPCTCLCYCTGAQLEHKHRVFPSRFWGKTCDPVDVPEAKALADERTESLRGYCPNCTSESCVRHMKEDGLYLP